MSSLRGKAAPITMALIGYLFFVEIVSGILQGYYVPLISDLVTHLRLDNDADFNIFEGTQLMLSALVVPLLAKLGDMYGHKKILLLSTVLTAGATWWLAFAPDFTSFLLAWTLQGFYVVWLPLEIALIFDRGRQTGAAASTTRKAAGFLIVGLEGGAIIGALSGGAVFAMFGGEDAVAAGSLEALNAAMVPTLMIPAIAVSLVFFVIWFGVPESKPLPNRKLDTGGFVMLTIGLLLITSGLTFLKNNPLDTWWIWALIALGIFSFFPFSLYELRHPDPAIDLRVFAQRNMWPIQLTAGLVGISLLGAQAPLSTYAGTDPALGYGLGLTSGQRSILIGVYLISMIVGALIFPLLSRKLSPKIALISGAVLVAIGYGLFLPFHLETAQVFTNMVVAGIGSGILMGAMPSAAAAAAPRGQTGVASALTNTTKTIGGSFASSIFAIVLTIGVIDAAGNAVTEGTAGSLTGYMIIWTICSLGAVLAVFSLLMVPKDAFTDASLDQAQENTPA